jgi:hypothetical protein
VAHLVVIEDVHTGSNIFSKEAKSDANLVLEIPTFQEDEKTRIQKLQARLGFVCTGRLDVLKEE